MKKLTAFLIALSSFLFGVIVGFAVSPIKNGICVGNNNGNNGGTNSFNPKDN